MSQINVFLSATLDRMPWKNGGGVTRQVVCHPPGTTINNFDWRISIADISSSGPFSLFPGVNRSLTLLSGPGVQLTSDDAHGAPVHTLDSLLAPYSFSGDVPLYSTLIRDGGHCRDFNVMVRRTIGSPQVSLFTASSAHAAADAEGRDTVTWKLPQNGAVFVCAGRWRLTEPDGTCHCLSKPMDATATSASTADAGADSSLSSTHDGAHWAALGSGYTLDAASEDAMALTVTIAPAVNE